MSNPPTKEAALSLPSRHPNRKKNESQSLAFELPDRFKNDNYDDDEPLRPPRAGTQALMGMNQSIFGLIAATGSNADFANTFDGSDEDSSDDEKTGTQSSLLEKDGRNTQQDLAKTAMLRKTSSEAKEKEGRGHRRRISGQQLLRSLPALPRFASKASSKLKPSRLKSNLTADPEQDEMARSASASPVAGPSSPSGADAQDHERPAPVLSKMLEARVEMSARPSFEMERTSEEDQGHAEDGGAGALAAKLKEIFEFDEPEEVIQEYPCSYRVLLGGYMYITSRHICFYAYVPQKNEVITSGYLSKCGRRNPKYNRYWFRLKGVVLWYYKDASNMYFPQGHIDLRYAISASVTDQDKEACHFQVEFHNRTVQFRADSASSAKEWVKKIQRIIFRSHNDGDSVKISLPIENILDVEESEMMDLAETVKIRVLDNDETYVVDEYFFSFYGVGSEAIDLLKTLVEMQQTQEVTGSENPSQLGLPRASQVASPSASRHQSPSGGEMLKVREPIKSTLSPDMAQPPSPSRSGRSFSGSRHMQRGDSQGSKNEHRRQPSSDSYVQSLEDPSGTSGLLESATTDDPSGSRILAGSEVFRSPTIRRSTSASGGSQREQSRGREGSRNGTSPASNQSHPATTDSVNEQSTNTKDKPASSEDPARLKSIVKLGAYPLQRASAFAQYVGQTGKGFGNMISNESMGYAEKVSGMWRGGHKHYQEHPSLKIHDDSGNREEDDPEQVAKANQSFRNHFGLPETENLHATYFGYLNRVLPLYGKIYLSNKTFCFRSLLPATRTKVIIPLTDIENVDKESGFRFGYHGLVVVIRGHEEIFFEFSQNDTRDDCAVTLLQCIEGICNVEVSKVLDKEEQLLANEAVAERDALHEARLQQNLDRDMKTSTSGQLDSSTILFDDKASFLNFKPSESMKITCLTIGSRGDVQPYIALCKGLLAEGHKPRIATHAEFRGWVESHGIEFSPVEGDPADLMRICIEHGTFTYQFLKVANSKFRGWLDELLISAYEAVKGSDLLIESPSAMGGIHIAEALGIPYFRAFTMPWTRTRAYPHAFVMPQHKMGGAYNYMTYVMFDNIFWRATAGQVNRWRRDTLGLPATDFEKMQPNKVPFLYNFSPAVVAPPLDYSDWIRVTGYWFLDEGDGYTPPDDLREFIEKARSDQKKLVYVGFGSIIVDDPAKMTQDVIDAVLKADVRCVLSKGWSDRLENNADKNAAAVPEVALPPQIFQIKSAPHDWLFAQMDAAAHHGGSGTTGASLRAGIPTIIRPFFGDQFFFGARVEDMGVGICLKKWGASSFARALWEATNSQRMIVKARTVGETIRKEDGVNTAIQCIYRDLEYATSLVQAKAGRNAAAAKAGATAGTAAEADFDKAEDEEESWTFVGGDEFDKMTASASSNLRGSSLAGTGTRIVSAGSIAERGRRNRSATDTTNLTMTTEEESSRPATGGS